MSKNNKDVGVLQGSITFCLLVIFLMFLGAMEHKGGFGENFWEVWLTSIGLWLGINFIFALKGNDIDPDPPHIIITTIFFAALSSPVTGLFSSLVANAIFAQH